MVNDREDDRNKKTIFRPRNNPQIQSMRALALFFFALCLAYPLSNDAADKPNIVIIFADDLGYADLSCQGSREIRTPRIDSIFTNGVRFTDGYVTAPQCSPSRAALLTGIYQQRFGHENNMTMDALMDAGARIFPEHLKPAGYVTGHFG